MQDRHAAHRGVYDAIAQAYDERQRPAPSPFLQESFEQLCAHVPAGGLVADLGCGPGHDLVRLAERGLVVVGVDASSGMLARAAARAPGRLAAGDLRRLPLATGSCAGVWSSYALLHLDDAELQEALFAVARVLAPGGVAVLVLAGRGSGSEPVSYVPGSASSPAGRLKRVAEARSRRHCA